MATQSDYIGERLTRSEQNEVFMLNFLDSSATSIERKLYSREIEKLQKRFPQVTIKRCLKCSYPLHLFHCTIEKIK